MSVNVSKRDVTCWRDVTVGKFDCHCQLADLEAGRELWSDLFYGPDSTWLLRVKGSKEWCPGVWKFDAKLRCLWKTSDVTCEIDMAVGEEKLRPVPSEMYIAFEPHCFTARLADRDVRGTYTRNGKLQFQLTITVGNSKKFVAKRTDLKFREETRLVDERETGGRLEGDTGKTEQPPLERETGGLEEGETGRTERPPPEPETGGLESETGRAEQPAPERETGDGPDTLLSRSIASEVGWLFMYCTCMYHLLDSSVAYWVSACVGLAVFRHLIRDVLFAKEGMIYLDVMVASSGCAFIPAYFCGEERTVQTDLMCFLLLLQWTLYMTVWRTKPKGSKTDDNESSAKS